MTATITHLPARKNTMHVTLYTKPGCQPCKAVKRFLKKWDIPFRESDVSVNLDDLRAIKALGYTGAPVVATTVNGIDDHWYGYRPDKLDELKDRL